MNYSQHFFGIAEELSAILKKPTGAYEALRPDLEAFKETANRIGTECLDIESTAAEQH